MRNIRGCKYICTCIYQTHAIDMYPYYRYPNVINVMFIWRAYNKDVFFKNADNNDISCWKYYYYIYIFKIYLLGTVKLFIQKSGYLIEVELGNYLKQPFCNCYEIANWSFILIFRVRV